MKIQNYCNSALSALWQHKKMASVLSGVSLLLAGYLLYTTYQHRKRPNNPPPPADPPPSRDRSIVPFVFPEPGQCYGNGVIRDEEPMPFMPPEILAMFFQPLSKEDSAALGRVNIPFFLTRTQYFGNDAVYRVSSLFTKGECSTLLEETKTLKDIPLTLFKTGLLKSAKKLSSLSVYSPDVLPTNAIEILQQLTTHDRINQLLFFAVTFHLREAQNFISILDRLSQTRGINACEVMFSFEPERDTITYEFLFNLKKVLIFVPKKTDFSFELTSLRITKFNANDSEELQFKAFLRSDQGRFLKSLQIGFPYGIDFTMNDFAVLCDRCPNLQSLTLKTTASINENVIESLKKLTNLEQIRLWIPAHLKTPSIEDMKRICPSLDMECSQIHQCLS
ncbi:MAG: hypothetical protein K940chlam8_01086 [Chlamydiae bacterium]|nr:hypothetical protein [Chlamydiota bacterium]